MPSYVFAFLMCGAALHVTWNALIREVKDRIVTTIAVSGGAAVVAACVLPFLAQPLPSCWPSRHTHSPVPSSRSYLRVHETGSRPIRAIAMGGAVAIVGLVGGLQVTINLAEIFQRNLRLDGIETGSRAMLEAMLAWFECKAIIPSVDRVFSFNESAAALNYLQAGGHIGKVCIAY